MVGRRVLVAPTEIDTFGWLGNKAVDVAMAYSNKHGFQRYHKQQLVNLLGMNWARKVASLADLEITEQLDWDDFIKSVKYQGANGRTDVRIDVRDF